ncbi:unnamed protein product [Adineta ricciae]|uniref:Uncharacterized protein n=1 Tax=Adineta ricciae TaxID=249248 RepID=A0A815P6R3_ADIRI|nr:unnamed protein product [Adineta ricciae]CAF1594759.1 unnamed protein product [Adineta ricciae]
MQHFKANNHNEVMEQNDVVTIDEENCFALEMNECEVDEYRCHDDSNYPTLYQCSCSSKTISLSRIEDTLNDCIEYDDVDHPNSCSLSDKHRIRCEGPKECWSPIQKQVVCKGNGEQSADIRPFESFCGGIQHHHYHDLNRKVPSTSTVHV